MTRSLWLVLLVLSVVVGPSFAQDKVFSGPQVGEKLKPFKVRGVFDDDAGKDLDFVNQGRRQADRPRLRPRRRTGRRSA